ncbi:MAG: polyhydroxybutyrate depolymerase [Roseobacter sp.]
MKRLIVYLIGGLYATSAMACGPDTDCIVGDRSYRIVMPEGHDGVSKVPVIAYAHGYQGSAAGVMRNGSLRRLASDLGAALLAFNSAGGSWILPNHPRQMDSDGGAEFAYVDDVLADATERFDLDSDRIMATGFSGGGMLIWNLACARSSSFAGFAPVSGTFWLQPPETCAAPVTSVVHIHGDSDKVVPLDGRPIGPSKQGEVSEALSLYEGFGGFSAPQDRVYGDLRCSERSNAEGKVLEFCLFAGGHSFRTEYVRHAWQRLVDAGQL